MNNKSLADTLSSIIEQNLKGKLDYPSAIEQIDAAISEANQALPPGRYTQLRDLRTEAHNIVGAMEMVNAGDESSRPGAERLERLRSDAAELE